MRLLPLLPFCLVMMPLPALATGGFGCTAEDANIAFSYSGALGRGLPTPPLNPEGRLHVKLKGVPADLASADLKDRLVHSWIEGGELRFHFYGEREGSAPHGGFEVVVKTKDTGDELTTAGTYQLRVFFMDPAADASEARVIEADGKVTCDVE